MDIIYNTISTHLQVVEDWPLFIKDQQGHDHQVLQFHSLLTLKLTLLNLNQLLTCEIKRSRNRFTSPLGKWFGTSQQDLSMEGGPFLSFFHKLSFSLI